MDSARGQESPNPCRGLGAKKTGRGQGRGELTLPKQRHSIGPVFGEGKVVGDGQQSHPPGRKGAKHRAQARSALGIERGRGFIKEEYGGPQRQGPGNGDPLLLAGGPGGYDSRVVHLTHEAAEPVTFTLSTGGGSDWQEVARVTVPAGGAAFHVLPTDIAGDWIRVTADRDAAAVTAVFRYGRRGGQVSDPALFAALADAASAEPWTGAVVRSAAGDGQWLPYAVLDVPPGETLTHEFPGGFSAHWIRFNAAAAGRATATLIYE